MKNVLILLLTLFVLLLNSCNDNGAKKNYNTNDSMVVSHEKTTEQLKAELRDLELTSPEKYLSLENVTIRDSMLLVLKPSLFNHSKFAKVGNIIHGIIKNTSTLAKYKDIVITVSYYSQTETLIGSKDYTLYEFYKPNSTNQFQLHVYPPDEWKNFNVGMKSATGVQ